MRFAIFLMMVSCAGAAEISVKGKAFAIDGKQVFLLGCSYYGGVGASEEIWKKDLDAMQKYGMNWIRVWGTWAAFGKDLSVVDEAGKIRAEYFEGLKKLIEECDRRGMIVDVTLTRGKDPGRLATFAAHQQAVEALVKGLKEKRNWYLDLANERNIGDARFVSYEELASLREAAKEIDKRRLITASHSGGDLTKKELEKYLKVVKVDFVSVHRPREKGTAQQTQKAAKEALGWMKELGREAPLQFDEPFRRGYSGWTPKAEDFLADLKGARAGGAAGWCFHNGQQADTPEHRPRRSFDLSQKSLFEQLDGEERKFLQEVGK